MHEYWSVVHARKKIELDTSTVLNSFSADKEKLTDRSASHLKSTPFITHICFTSFSLKYIGADVCTKT